jgi:hypothetical protein
MKRVIRAITREFHESNYMVPARLQAPVTMVARNGKRSTVSAVEYKKRGHVDA